MDNTDIQQVLHSINSSHPSSHMPTSDTHSWMVPMTGTRRASSSACRCLASRGTTPAFNIATLFLRLLLQLQRARAAQHATSVSERTPVDGVPGRPGSAKRLTCRQLQEEGLLPQPRYVRMYIHQHCSGPTHMYMLYHTALNGSMRKD